MLFLKKKIDIDFNEQLGARLKLIPINKDLRGPYSMVVEGKTDFNVAIITTA